MKLYIECNSRRILSQQAFKCVPKDQEILDEIVLITKNCQNAGSDYQDCKHCKGVCVSINQEYFDDKAKNFAIKKTILRDKTTINKAGEVKEHNKASQYIGNMDKIFSLDSKVLSPSEAKVTLPWRAYDKPDSWESDCLKCKEKARSEDRLTECELTEQFISQLGFDPRSCPSSLMYDIEVPESYRCKNQTQKVVLIY